VPEKRVRHPGHRKVVTQDDFSMARGNALSRVLNSEVDVEFFGEIDIN
jgi:hypothetical protein